MAISIIDEINSLTNFTEAMVQLAPLLRWLVLQAGLGRPRLDAPRSYENVSLSIRLTICDKRGRRAILERVQRVRFLAEEAGVVRDVVWGDGDALKSYTVSGARLLAVNREGSKQIVLLGIGHRPAQGEVVTVRSERTIVGGMTRAEEYLETEVERETDQMELGVVFPRGRPPLGAFLESSPPQTPSIRAVTRWRSDGRATVGARIPHPELLARYRLRWSW